MAGLYEMSLDRVGTLSVVQEPSHGWVERKLDVTEKEVVGWHLHSKKSYELFDTTCHRRLWHHSVIVRHLRRELLWRYIRWLEQIWTVLRSRVHQHHGALKLITGEINAWYLALHPQQSFCLRAI